MSLFKDYTGNLAGSKGNLLNAAAGAVGGLAGGLIGGGYETGAGSMLSGLGSIASSIPGPWGAAIGGGLQLLGGLTNRAFGWKANKENIAQVQNITDQLNSFNSNAGDWDSYLVGLENMPSKMNFSNSFIGTNGWFNNKADDKANELRNNMNNAFASAMRSVQNNRNNIATTQAQNLRAVSAALGGPLTMRRGALTPFGSRFNLGGPLHTNGGDWSNGLIFINEGDTHEQNPNDGVQMGIDPEGIPNLVEEGEVVWNNYVFSNRLKVPKAVRQKYKLRGQKDMTFADAVKNAQKESEERPNDPIAQRGLDDILMKLAFEQEAKRQKTNNGQYSQGGGIHIKPNYNWETGLRYVPALGSAISVFSDLMGWTNKPDYSNADAILNASKGVRDVRFDPIGDYIAYNPFDRMFYLNQLNANAGANRRAITNASAGNRGAAMSGLLASDYNTLNSIGQLGRQAEEYNLAQRQKVADFNRATNMFNSEGSLKAQQANQGAAEVRMRAAAEAAKLRDTIDARIDAARSANLTNLFDSIGNIGWEAFNRNMVNSSNPLFGIRRDGNTYYKPEAKNFMTDKEREEYNNPNTTSQRKNEIFDIVMARYRNRADGGYITIKGRRK